MVNIASVVGGAVPSLLARALQATYGNWAIALVLAAIALVSLAWTYLLPEIKGAALQSIRIR